MRVVADRPLTSAAAHRHRPVRYRRRRCPADLLPAHVGCRTSSASHADPSATERISRRLCSVLQSRPPPRLALQRPGAPVRPWAFTGVCLSSGSSRKAMAVNRAMRVSEPEPALDGCTLASVLKACRAEGDKQCGSESAGFNMNSYSRWCATEIMKRIMKDVQVKVEAQTNSTLITGLAFSARPSVFRHGGNQSRRGVAIVGLKKPDRRMSGFRPNRLFIRTFRKIGNPSSHHMMTVVASFVAFNAKAFFRKSIVFLSYETPVPGPKPGECDVAWRFRNRREKSWRRYRDYRRFALTPGDGCALDITRVGKFRSGANAARPPRPKGSKNRNPRVAPPPVDAEINDTIPIVGSEAEFRKGKYLYYMRGGDHCKSMNQFIWSFLCGLGEAKFLNRTFVMDLNMCLSGAHTDNGKDEDGKDFRYYFDFEHLKETASVVEEGDFLKDWKRWDKKKGPGKITVRKVPSYKVTPMQLKRDKSNIIWRLFDGQEPENYWYRVCEGRAAKVIQRPWYAIWKSKRLMNIVTEIAGRMDWDYDGLHVVRGWKAQNKQMYPNLDADTSPETLVNKVTKLIKPMRNLYIATNEPFYNYFDKLRSHFHVHLLDDYKELWSSTSEWYNETTTLSGGRPVLFDAYMRVIVDTEVFYRSKTQVETFNNLTRDCKDGINTCNL
uniref:Uncharacterized protein n=1 Tax=Oryza brachyantha TaxID=4533 RepID=J3MNA8_ORYBR